MSKESFIEENWNNYKRSELADKLNISMSSLYNIAEKIGIEINSELSSRAKTPKWTEKEIQFLKENYHRLSTKCISEKINRTVFAINIKARDLDLEPKSKKWTDEEIKLLKTVYLNSSTDEIIRMIPSHTIGSINKKAKKLGIIRKNISRPKWTDEEKKEVISLAKQGYTDKEISVKLNRSINNVKIIRRKKIKYKLWSEEEIVLLKNKYSTSTIDELEKLFPQKTRKQISYKASRLKLTKTEETLRRCFNVKTEIPKRLDKTGCWRRKILRRDEFCCMLCGFIDKTGMSLQAHHIKPARDCNRKEKYDTNNGICLCIECHKKITGNEYNYIDLIRRNDGLFKRR